MAKKRISKQQYRRAKMQANADIIEAGRQRDKAADRRDAAAEKRYEAQAEHDKRMLTTVKWVGIITIVVMSAATLLAPILAG